MLAVMVVGLSGCFTSETPLISAEDADFPFETFTYREVSADKLITMVREGDAYLIEAPDIDGRLEIRLMDIGDGLYLAQAHGEKDGTVSLLYSVLKVDFEKRTAESYLAVADEKFATKGLRQCDDGKICIDDLDVYLELARRSITAGDEPDVTYKLVATNPSR